MENINYIVVVINEKYVAKLMVMLKSLFLSNPHQQFFIFIFYANLSKKSRENLNRFFEEEDQQYNFIQVDIKLFDCAPILDSDMSKEAYFKLLIPEQLPESIERVLYLDVDIIVNGDINLLYRIDLGEKSFAAVRDFNMDRDRVYKLVLMEENYTYFNSGVLLFDLKKFRKVYSLKKALEYIQKNGHKFRFHDQEVLNALFHKHVKIIDEKFNFVTLYKDRWDPILYRFRDKLNEIIIIHYAAGNNKPWKPEYCGKFLEKYWNIAKNMTYDLNYSDFMKERKKRRILIWKTKFCIIFPDMKAKIKKFFGR